MKSEPNRQSDLKMVTAVFVLVTLLILARRKPRKSRKAIQERIARAA